MMFFPHQILFGW